MEAYISWLSGQVRVIIESETILQKWNKNKNQSAGKAIFPKPKRESDQCGHKVGDRFIWGELLKTNPPCLTKKWVINKPMHLL